MGVQAFVKVFVIILARNSFTSRSILLFSQQELSLGRPIQCSKSTWGEQPVEDIPNFTCICLYLFIYLRQASWPNEIRYRPEIWHTYSHWPYRKMGFFIFSIKSPWRPLAVKKLPCHVDFPHISSIALFIYLLNIDICLGEIISLSLYHSYISKNINTQNIKKKQFLVPKLSKFFEFVIENYNILAIWSNRARPFF